MPDEVPVVRDDQLIADDLPPGRGPQAGAALCLSGGGYRAMLFHLGTVWYLHQAGWLTRLARISSVSGGSILAGYLAMKWTTLFPNGAKKAKPEVFDAELVRPIRTMASTTIDAGSILGGIFSADSVGEKLIHEYEKHLFGTATLQSFPDAPRFVINATNVQSGALFRFSKPYIADYRVGQIKNPTLRISNAVAASSAFPPVLSPVTLKFPAGAFVPNTKDLGRPPYTREVVLSDGGVYDNMGIETAWKRYRTILVSDAGGKLQPEEDPKHDWLRHAVRINGLIDNQVRSLRKRQVISSFLAKQRQGAYWGTRSDIAKYPVANPFDAPFAKTIKLAEIETRLERMPKIQQERLINWGFAIADAAMRLHVDPKLTRPATLPYPTAGIG
ncbi:MAG TPA: patatin-like phospholipase family protein [Thermoanaerobaculia bacterium]|nr:patatin-like phospholipase family protein [Thermoanaerobaculia bacterium]